MGDFGGGPVQGQELDFMILVGPIQSRIFYDCRFSFCLEVLYCSKGFFQHDASIFTKLKFIGKMKKQEELFLLLR